MTTLRAWSAAVGLVVTVFACGGADDDEGAAADSLGSIVAPRTFVTAGETTTSAAVVTTGPPAPNGLTVPETPTVAPTVVETPTIAPPPSAVPEEPSLPLDSVLETPPPDLTISGPEPSVEIGEPELSREVEGGSDCVLVVSVVNHGPGPAHDIEVSIDALTSDGDVRHSSAGLEGPEELDVNEVGTYLLRGLTMDEVASWGYDGTVTIAGTTVSTFSDEGQLITCA